MTRSRTLVERYPRATTYIVIVVTLILLLQLADLMRE